MVGVWTYCVLKVECRGFVKGLDVEWEKRGVV